MAESGETTGYQIGWKAPTGKIGRGETVFTKEVAKDIAQQANQELPEVKHQAVPASKSPTKTPSQS